MDAWNTIFSIGEAYFQWRTVSFREGTNLFFQFVLRVSFFPNKIYNLQLSDP